MTDATDRPITHDDAQRALARVDGLGPDGDVLNEYIAQQRALAAARATAGGVRVVEVLQEPEDHNRSVDYPINIKAGQTLAIIEPLSPQEKPRGNPMCMGCVGTGHMEGFGTCPHCKGSGNDPHAPSIISPFPSPPREVPGVSVHGCAGDVICRAATTQKGTTEPEDHGVSGSELAGGDS